MDPGHSLLTIAPSYLPGQQGERANATSVPNDPDTPMHDVQDTSHNVNPEASTSHAGNPSDAEDDLLKAMIARLSQASVHHATDLQAAAHRRRSLLQQLGARVQKEHAARKKREKRRVGASDEKLQEHRRRVRRAQAKACAKRA